MIHDKITEAINTYKAQINSNSEEIQRLTSCCANDVKKVAELIASSVELLDAICVLQSPVSSIPDSEKEETIKQAAALREYYTLFIRTLDSVGFTR